MFIKIADNVRRNVKKKQIAEIKNSRNDIIQICEKIFVILINDKKIIIIPFGLYTKPNSKSFL